MGFMVGVPPARGQVKQLLVLFCPAVLAEADPAEGAPALRYAVAQSSRARGHGAGWGVGEESGDTPPRNLNILNTYNKSL